MPGIHEFQDMYSYIAAKTQPSLIFKNFDISGRGLRLHRISAMVKQREWFTPAVLDISTSYMKIICMKNSLKFSKTVSSNKIKKTNFVYAIIRRHVLQWFLPFILTAILSNRSI